MIVRESIIGYQKGVIKGTEVEINRAGSDEFNRGNKSTKILRR